MPSTVIRRISYDHQTRTLFVTFVSGACYAYLDVPPQTFVDFDAAFSKGRHFATQVRDRFVCRQMQVED